MQGKLKIWLLAARPKTLSAAISPIIIGTALASADGALHLPSALAALLAAVLIQVGTNYANDYFDFIKGVDTSARIGPQRATQAGLVPPATMRIAFIAVFALAMVIGLYLVWRGGWVIVAIGSVSILLGVLYTATPFALAYTGLADLFVLIFFGPVAVGGTYYVQSLRITPEALIAGLAPGLLSTAILTVNNLRDLPQDRQAGRRTLAVRFGASFARWQYAACLAGAAAVPLWLCLRTGGHFYALTAMLIIAPAIPIIRKVFTTSGAALNEVLAQTGKILLFFSVLFAAGWLL